LIDKRERYFIRHRLVLRAKRQQGAALPLWADEPDLSALSVIMKAVANRQAAYTLAGGDTVRITKVDIRPAENLCVLLFRRRNPKAATQVFEDADSEGIRPAERGPKDDPAVSMHLFVQLTPHKGDAASHRAIVEEVQGLGPSYVKLLLDEVVRSKEYHFEDSRGQTKSTSTKVDLWGVPSRNLRDSVAKNGFDFIELVRQPELGGLDTEGLTVRPERLRLYPKRDRRDAGALLERVVGWAKPRGWSDISVQVKEFDKTKVVRIGRDHDAATTLFVRADLVRVTKDLPTCSDAVNEELVAAAAAMLADDASWK